MQKQRVEFIEKIQNLDINKIVALDESSVNLAYTRLYGRAKRSERVSEGVMDTRFERKSVLSTIRLSGEMCTEIFKGTLNNERFSIYIKEKLAPTLADDDILLLDNSSVHRSKLVKQTLEECGINCLFLPPYSPDYNPIELLWSWMKSNLKKAKARTHEKLEEAIYSSFNALKLDFISNWFGHCGFFVKNTKSENNSSLR